MRSIWPSEILSLAWARAKLGDRDAGFGRVSTGAGGIRRSRRQLGLLFHQGRLAEIEAERGRRGSRPHRNRWSAGAGGRDRRALVRRRTPSHSRRNPPQTKPRRPRPGRSRLPRRHRRRATAEGPQLRAARRARASKALSNDGRPADAHDVLGPALEGFSPTPEFPQIAEAKALFGALAADEGVKAAAARRAQRLKLQTDYGQAVLWAEGLRRRGNESRVRARSASLRRR